MRGGKSQQVEQSSVFFFFKFISQSQNLSILYLMVLINRYILNIRRRTLSCVRSLLVVMVFLFSSFSQPPNKEPSVMESRITISVTLHKNQIAIKRHRRINILLQKKKRKKTGAIEQFFFLLETLCFRSREYMRDIVNTSNTFACLHFNSNRLLKTVNV